MQIFYFLALIQVFLKFFFCLYLKKILVILISLNIGALFIIILFGYYPWVPKFWVPNSHGYPWVIPKKNPKFWTLWVPNPKIPMEFRHKPNPTHTQNLARVRVLPLGTRTLGTQFSQYYAHIVWSPFSTIAKINLSLMSL
jgi:hypothetical protein